MVAVIENRVRVPVKSLPAGIPNIPAFEGESELDAAKEGAAFFGKFRDAIREAKWENFASLFADITWWRDNFTLTWDKRTLHGRDKILNAWKELSTKRMPAAFSLATEGSMKLPIAFNRSSPNLATLDVGFTFTTKEPDCHCFGRAQLIPVNGVWRIWILSTAALSLVDHPFQSLPHHRNTGIAKSQRGQAVSHGLPKIDEVLDVIVIGASASGLANTAMLDAIGLKVAAFDAYPSAGAVWADNRYENITLHHTTFHVQFPFFPVPADDGYTTYLSGPNVKRYMTAYVKECQLPVFYGVKVVANHFDEVNQVWTTSLRDVMSGQQSSIQAKTIVVSTGFFAPTEAPNIPNLKDRNLFKGRVDHTSQYRDAKPYEGKNVVIIGSGNSAHDVAHNLVLGNAESVTILQRSPTVLLDLEAMEPMFALYNGSTPIDLADFLDLARPVAVTRDLAKGFLSAVISGQEKRNAEFESKGYMLDRNPCLIERFFEEKGRSFYYDQPGTFKLVFEDRIRIARGEAKGFVEGGLVVHDKMEGTDKVITADDLVLATGFSDYDLPKKWAETGFVDPGTASVLENVSLLGVDAEGEIPGLGVFSGHPRLYFSGLAFAATRWMARNVALQIAADVNNIAPERYPRYAE